VPASPLSQGSKSFSAINTGMRSWILATKLLGPVMIMVHDFSVSAQVAAAEPQVPAAETNSADHPQSGAGYGPNYSGGDMTRPENFFEVRAFDTASGTATPTDTQSLVLRRGRPRRGSEANQPSFQSSFNTTAPHVFRQGNLVGRLNERFLAASRWPVQLSFTMILPAGPEQCMVFHPS
jgi:hypothetical protein